MQTLQKRGLNQVLTDCYRSGKPMLGICIGIQILFEHSEEEDAECLGLLPGQIKKYPAADIETGTETLKVPQIGWNEVYQTQSHPIFADVPNPAHFYFCQLLLSGSRDTGHRDRKNGVWTRILQCNCKR